MMRSSILPSADTVRANNWIGAIPIVLTLAPTSLGTTMMPAPLHVMVNRGAFLHVGLKSAIQRLHKFAPATISFGSSSRIVRQEPEPQGDLDGNDDNQAENDNDTTTTDATNQQSSSSSTSKTQQINKDQASFPVCWLEDEETQIPLRWHLFAGVLFDMMQSQYSRQQSSSLVLSSIQTQPRVIPWKLRLHFSSYPSSQILPLESNEVMTTIERSFKSSLKQALFLQYGNSKVAMNITKQNHHRLWHAVELSNYKLYQQINVDLQATATTPVQLIPVRLLLDSKPPMQRPCPGTESKSDSNEPTILTLGSLLNDWLPALFQKKEEGKVEPGSDSYQWRIAGIQPPLTTPILELWENLCHPDHFLYIIILSR